MITDEQKTKLADYFSTQPVDAVYLFGSQVTGKMHAESDVDVAVLFRQDVDRRTRFDFRLQFASAVGRITGHPDHSDVVDLEEAPLALQMEAIRSRNLILERDHSRSSQFDAAVRTRYFDYVLLIKQNTPISLRAFAALDIGK